MFSFAFEARRAYDYAPPFAVCRINISVMSSSSDSAPSLDTLRQRIDELDNELHDLLMERARVIEGIVAAKRAKGVEGVMFRPAREADMMHRLVARHDSALPLTTVEHIWRDIITTCTQLQGEFALHVDGSGDLAAMIDLARFYFGFSTQLDVAGDASDVIGAVAASQSDLGLVGLDTRSELPWWRGLGDSGAQIIARLPFLVIEDRPADLPAVVVSRAVPEETPPETVMFDARWHGALPGNLMASGIEVVSFCRHGDGVDALLAAPSDMSCEDVERACATAGGEPDVVRTVGGYAAPIDMDAEDGFEPAS